jgi:hypothetical protein
VGTLAEYGFTDADIDAWIKQGLRGNNLRRFSGDPGQARLEQQWALDNEVDLAYGQLTGKEANIIKGGDKAVAEAYPTYPEGASESFQTIWDATRKDRLEQKLYDSVGKMINNTLAREAMRLHKALER